jgi:hypothetical protein
MCARYWFRIAQRTTKAIEYTPPLSRVSGLTLLLSLTSGEDVDPYKIVENAKET